MALGTIGAALASTALSTGLSYGASKLFGGGSGGGLPTAPLTNFQAPGINAGGLTTSYGPDGNLTVGASAERMGLVGGVRNVLGTNADSIAALRARVAPGISELRASRLGEIESARDSAIGNLRENLQRRRVLGSSFGQDALTRAESEFAGQRDRVAAETFLQEFEATNQLINQEFQLRREAVQTGLDELNLEANLAASLSGKATETLGANARMLAQLNAKEAEGAGKFFGQTFQPLFKSIGDSAGSLFKGDGGVLSGGAALGMGGIGSA